MIRRSRFRSARSNDSGEAAAEGHRRSSLELAIDKVRPGNRLFDICGTVERHVTRERVYDRPGVCGTRNRDQLHEEPQIPNYVDRKNENPRLKEGMVLAIEPMVNLGKAGIEDAARTVGRR